MTSERAPAAGPMKATGCGFPNWPTSRTSPKPSSLELVDCGALTPDEGAPGQWVFGLRSLTVARTARRLREDFELEPHGVALLLASSTGYGGWKRSCANCRRGCPASSARRRRPAGSARPGVTRRAACGPSAAGSSASG